jgi:hypothetical protein
MRGGTRADVNSAIRTSETSMATDPLNVTRLRALALEAREAAKRAKAQDVRRQYEDIAHHYDALIEAIVTTAARRVGRMI